MKSNKNKFYSLEKFGSREQLFIIALFVLHEGKKIPVGTGFMIGVDGLMLTAGHVIDEAYSYRGKRLGDNGQTYEHWEFYAPYLTNEPVNGGELFGGLWPIDNVWRPKDLDIGLSYLRPAYRNGGRIKFPVCTLSFNIPKIGSEIMGFGYFNMKVDIYHKPLSVTHYQETTHTIGKVIAAHPVKRDSVMLSFPSFETDARFDSGMSGGPIFNELGNVCGIICSSFDSSNDEEHISFASLPWPLLGVSIRVSLETGSKPTSVLIYDLVKLGIISTDKSINNVLVNKGDEEQTWVSLRYTE